MVTPTGRLATAIATAALTAIAARPTAATPTVDWRPAGGGLFADLGLPGAASSPAPPVAAGALPALRQPYAEAIEGAAQRAGLDPKLLHALVLVESAYRARALSPAGAAGLTQLMPATAADLGVHDRFDAAENLAGGAGYLARQLMRFGDLRLALAAYNAGPERVARLGRTPDIPETQAYVRNVIDCYLALAAGRSVRSPLQCRPSGPLP